MTTRALVLGALLIASLAVAALRIDLLRVRYGLGAAVAERTELEEQRRALQARIRELRDPARLARIAREGGWVRPARIVDLAAAEGPQ